MPKKKSDDYSKIRTELNKTSGQKKLWNYLHGLSDDRAFIARVRTLRAKYEIPKNGFKPTYGKGAIYGKKVVLMPDSLRDTDIWLEMLKLTEELGLEVLWTDTVQHFVIHNDWNMDWLGGMFFAIDANHMLYSPYPEYEDFQDMIQQLRRIATSNPLMLLISPYASQRDIVDYVKKMYKSELKPILKAHQKKEVKIGKYRTRNTRVAMRNRFIYENRTLRKKELISKVSATFGDVLDYTYVNKIIAEYKNKRSEHG